MKTTYAKENNEGYAEVQYEDVWNLDTRLARIIAMHLHAFLKAQKGPYGGCPGTIYEQYGENGFKLWLQYIRKMIYAFEEYPNLKDAKNSDESIEEKKARIKEGMSLFIKYFNYLRI